MKTFKFFLTSVIFALFFFTFVKHSMAQAPAGRDLVPDNYIVVFKDAVTDPVSSAGEIAQKHDLLLNYTYDHALKGFSAVISSAKLARIKSDPRVAYITQDKVVSADVRVQTAQVLPTGVSRIMTNPLNKGTGVGVAVIDTGIDLTHPDLSANILGAYSCIKGKPSGNDDNGHGTHVAGTIAALNNSLGVVGVAPEAKLYAVKVLNSQGSGTWSSVICGINWVTAHAAGIQVANMSLGGTGSSDNNCGKTDNDALHQAICRSRDAGVTYVVAAGNESDDASKHVPSAYNDAVITVSALADSDGLSGGNGPSTSYGADDTFASFGNFGSVVDLGAPGVSIYSTWKGGGYNTISGTSMATPHVAGAAALYLRSHPGASWSSVRDGLITAGESLGLGHLDPSGLHPEKIVLTGSL